ncbi:MULTISPECIES: YfiT family bacillithiol transferase [Paenibacillus]|uniref:YfiT family bacillithiol transferase n=1 Tax=Paenibacillus TaxID=44249 RepID=UPI0011A5B110|nr:putative metal-dependent hydrolase [Paenibacillus sp. IHBB 10380]
MDLRYPIGPFAWEGTATAEQRESWISDIAKLPSMLSDAVQGLSDDQLDLPYREGGWSIRQVVHHLADSHMNSYIRFKLALTEDNPTIKPYDEQKWTMMQDATIVNVQVSLTLIEGLHARWAAVLNAMNPGDFDRTFYHPESQKTMSLDYATGMYAWHGKHHTAHITSLRERLAI